MMNNHFNYISICLLIITASLFTHCGKSQSNDTSIRKLETYELENNNELAPAQFHCTVNKKLSIWLDTNNDQIKDQYLGDITSFKGSLNATDNYNYFSASAHPIVGPTPAGYESHVFFYEGPDGLSLNFYHNVDNGGSTYNEVNWDIFTLNNNMIDDWILQDDPNEAGDVIRIDSNKSKYEAYFKYWSNTDGGVIGPFSGEQFEIHVSTLLDGDNISAAFYSSDGKSFPLMEGTQNSISSFVITFSNHNTCSSL